MPFALPIYATPYTDYAARVSIVEGYNTNTYQTLDASADGKYLTAHRNPSPLTEVDGQLEARVHTSPDDLHIFRLGGRVVHYEPLQSEYQTDDASAVATYAGRYTLTPRTIVAVLADGAILTQNAAHLSDTTFFEFDPTTVRRTFWVSAADVTVTQELSHTWRLRQGVGVIVSGTVSQPPELVAATGLLVEHRGLDFVQPLVSTDFIHDVSERTMIDLSLLLTYAYNVYVLDLTQNPPRNIGPDTFASARLMFGHTYRFSAEVSNYLAAGGVLAQAPPRDPDQRPILTPTVLDIFSITKEFWGFLATGGVTYGSVNPRLGAGPTANAALILTGTPYRRGKWRNFSIMSNAQASYSSLATGVTETTKLSLVAADLEARYALNPWLGLHGGYRVRYATIDTPVQPSPPFLQQIVFFGLSAYWSTDKSQPPLMQFAPQLR
jgi:hypothetical protein